jgi:hypothetical protein
MEFSAFLDDYGQVASTLQRSRSGRVRQVLVGWRAEAAAAVAAAASVVV